MEILNASTSSAYSLDTQGWFPSGSSSWFSFHLPWADWLQLMWSGFELKFSFPMEGIRGSLGRVQTVGDKCCWGDKSSGDENLCNVPQRPIYDGPSQHTRRRACEGSSTPSSKHGYMQKPLRAKPPQEKQWDLDFSLGENSVGYSQHRQFLAIHLSVLLVQGFPTSPTCRSAWCLQETPIQLHVPPATILYAKVSGPCLSMSGQTS